MSNSTVSDKYKDCEVALDSDSTIANLCDKLDELNARLEEKHGDLLFLQCLEEAGVDNWDGYGYAQDIFEERSQ